MKKHLITITLATGLLAFQEVRAFNPQPEPPGFGMFGVTPGQTLRLNVSDVPAASPVLYAPPCRVELTFLDSEGNQLLPAVQETIKVGASVHIDLNGDSLFPATTDAVSPTPARAEVRPLIHFLRVPTATAISLLPPGPCIATIEIIDNRTGQTLLTSGAQTPGSLVEFNPQPDPPRTPKTFGIMGIIPGQTARINAVNVGEPGNVSIPPPCRVTLAFFDVDGNAVSRASDILKPGEATFLDFPSAISTTSTIAVNTPGDVAPASQLQLRGVVTVSSTTPGAFAPPCRATFEAFDSLSGKTTAVQSPQRFLIAN